MELLTLLAPEAGTDLSLTPNRLTSKRRFSDATVWRLLLRWNSLFALSPGKRIAEMTSTPIRDNSRAAAPETPRGWREASPIPGGGNRQQTLSGQRPLVPGQAPSSMRSSTAFGIRGSPKVVNAPPHPATHRTRRREFGRSSARSRAQHWNCAQAAANSQPRADGPLRNGMQPRRTDGHGPRAPALPEKPTSCDTNCSGRRSRRHEEEHRFKLTHRTESEAIGSLCLPRDEKMQAGMQPSTQRVQAGIRFAGREWCVGWTSRGTNAYGSNRHNHSEMLGVDDRSVRFWGR